jgi:hypothetical protein
MINYWEPFGNIIGKKKGKKEGVVKRGEDFV